MSRTVRDAFPVKSLNRETHIVGGRFRPNGSSAISTKLGDRGWTVAYTSTGLYTVTWEEAYPELLFAGAILQMNALTDTQLQLGAFSLSSKTLLIRAGNYDAEGVFALVDIASDANNWIHWWASFRKTSIAR